MSDDKKTVVAPVKVAKVKKAVAVPADITPFIAPCQIRHNGKN